MTHLTSATRRDRPSKAKQSPEPYVLYIISLSSYRWAEETSHPPCSQLPLELTRPLRTHDSPRYTIIPRFQCTHLCFWSYIWVHILYHGYRYTSMIQDLPLPFIHLNDVSLNYKESNKNVFPEKKGEMPTEQWEMMECTYLGCSISLLPLTSLIQAFKYGHWRCLLCLASPACPSPLSEASLLYP